MTDALPTVSLLTLCRGREDHLRNLLRGVARQTRASVEVLIAVMGEAEIADLPDPGVPLRQILVPGDELPLAAARNAAARAATGEVLAFLDVDCIPDPAFVQDHAAAMAGFDGLAMGEVLYLPAGATAGDWSEFPRIGVRHSDRQGAPAGGFEVCTDYRCFWSLTFAMRRATFLKTGGFDEAYRGYGAEDTDFGKQLSMAGVPIAWIAGARCYHQHHPHHMPPIHHLDSVVRNAQLFEEKWGYRTMGHWLHAFRLMGLIDDRPREQGGIRILRQPDEADRRLTGQLPDQPYVNTATVIRALEARMAGQGNSIDG